MELGHLSGARSTLTRTVEYSQTASAVGSGGVDVFSTPSMILLMEQAARDAVATLLPRGYTTVGIEVNVQHLAATPVGEDVTVVASVMEVDGRKLLFSVTASDGCGMIGKGTHRRFVVKLDEFMDRLKDRHGENSSGM